MLTVAFENYVNYAGSKTSYLKRIPYCWFENYVNYAGSKTTLSVKKVNFKFENYVNYAGSKTEKELGGGIHRLRTM